MGGSGIFGRFALADEFETVIKTNLEALGNGK